MPAPQKTSSKELAEVIEHCECTIEDVVMEVEAAGDEHGNTRTCSSDQPVPGILDRDTTRCRKIELRQHLEINIGRRLLARDIVRGDDGSEPGFPILAQHGCQQRIDIDA